MPLDDKDLRGRIDPHDLAARLCRLEEGLSPSLQFGTYTPTLTPIVNINSLEFRSAHFTRVGDIVQVALTIQVSPTAAGITGFRASLPIASDFNILEDLTGLATFAGSGAGANAGIGAADLVTNEAQWFLESGGFVNEIWRFHMTYEVL